MKVTEKNVIVPFISPLATSNKTVPDLLVFSHYLQEIIATHLIVMK